MKARAVLTIIVAGATATGCASTPRDFAPQVAAAPTAAAQEGPSADDAVATCRRLVGAGQRADFNPGRRASTTAGVLTTAGTGALAVPVVGLASFVGSTGAAVAISAAVPVLGLLAAYGVSRSVRAGREKEIKGATELCLAEHGYAVTAWRQVEPPAPAEITR